MKRRIVLWSAAPLMAVALTACTNKAGESESPVTISVNIKQQPGFVSVSANAPVQLTEIDLLSHLKSDKATDPQGFATVQLNYYTVQYSRRDGGKMVPPTATFAVGGTITAGGTATLNNYPVMLASTTQQSPFDQLLPFNGGIDQETGLPEIQMFFSLTFFGTTVSGQRVQSETAISTMIFGP
jgi:hypothetical protein